MSRRKRDHAKPSDAPTTTRCAIYTRKSSDEGLQQDFNSLDAQREAAEAYVASQKAEGWVCLPARYDDGGFTGGNLERPALQRLLADIEAGGIDCIVVYKVDRLSRSLMDFARIVEILERRRVSFVSVTQHFNTTDSMGRLTLNILLSFAQFEREIIGERIRDKIAASRAKGRWTGGTPILGYDVDRATGGPRLIVNPHEAAHVREIFELYLELGSLLTVVEELERRGWRNKAWTTRAGRPRGGLSFDKCRLHALLTNVLYVGRVRHKNATYAGQHEPIVAENVFDRVQRRLKDNGRAGPSQSRNRHGALLRGLLRCKACGRAMSHTFTTRKTRRYRYYTCTNAVKRGRRVCPSGSLPAAEIENAVVDQIRCIGADSALVREAVETARQRRDDTMARLARERRTLQRQRRSLQVEAGRESDDESPHSGVSDRLAELNQRIESSKRRIAEIDNLVAELQAERVEGAEFAAALADFDDVWRALSPRERVRLVHLLVRRVTYDADASVIEITFHETGIAALIERRSNTEDQAA